MNAFYDAHELAAMGFKAVGQNVLLSRKSSIYGAESISLGDNVRIDDFCIFSGNITLHSNIHISAFCALYGSNGIEIKSYAGLSPRCTLLSATDDFSGQSLVGPMVLADMRNVQGGPIEIGRYAQVGACSVIMPALTLHEGVAVGAMSLVKCSLPAWHIYAGIPAKVLKKRSKNILRLVGADEPIYT